MKYKDDLISCLLEYEKSIISHKWKDEPFDYVTRIREITEKHFKSITPKEFSHIKNILSIHNSYVFYLKSIDPNRNILWDLEERQIFIKNTCSAIYEFIKELLGDINKTEYKQLHYVMPNGVLTKDVTNIINLTYEEILIDYTNSCFISSIALCGKVIETALTALFIKVFNKNPDDEKLGFNAMVNRLKASGYEFHSATIDQMSVISTHRNKAIHGSIQIPTRDEARGVISLTKDILLKTSSK